MTGQNVARTQLRDGVRNRANRIAGRDPEDSEVDWAPVCGNHIVRTAAGIDEDALSAKLDQERKRLARDPIIDFLRRQVLKRTIKRNGAKEAVMLGWENVNDGILHRYRPAPLHNACLTRGHAE